MVASRHYRILAYNHIASAGLRRFPAERYRVSTAILRRSNSLKSESVRVGQVLTIPF